MKPSEEQMQWLSREEHPVATIALLTQLPCALSGHDVIWTVYQLIHTAQSCNTPADATAANAATKYVKSMIPTSDMIFVVGAVVVE